MEICTDCGAERPSWLGGAHKCHADYRRSYYDRPRFTWVSNAEPHTAEEYFREYLTCHDVHHNFPSHAPVLTAVGS